LSARKNKFDFNNREQNKSAVQRFMTDTAEPEIQDAAEQNIKEQAGVMRIFSEESKPVQANVPDAGISAQLEKLSLKLDELAASKQEEKPKYILLNAMEEAVREEVRATMNNVNICRCDKCYYDVCALVLNNSPPQYVTSQEGALFKKASALLSMETLTRLSAEIFSAIAKVKNKPAH
jgi:competence protein ComFB